jgi:hypothetical protein
MTNQWNKQKHFHDNSYARIIMGIEDQLNTHIPRQEFNPMVPRFPNKRGKRFLPLILSTLGIGTAL